MDVSLGNQWEEQIEVFRVWSCRCIFFFFFDISWIIVWIYFFLLYLKYCWRKPGSFANQLTSPIRYKDRNNYEKTLTKHSTDIWTEREKEVWEKLVIKSFPKKLLQLYGGLIISHIFVLFIIFEIKFCPLMSDWSSI